MAYSETWNIQKFDGIYSRSRNSAQVEKSLRKFFLSDSVSSIIVEYYIADQYPQNSGVNVPLSSP